MNFYEFTTLWKFEAPIEKIWNEIRCSEKWSEWWRGVLEVKELKAGDEMGAGKIVRSTWRSVLPYKLNFDSEVIRIEPLKLFEARAFGELEGTGIWMFEAETENITSVQYDWKVKTGKVWMNFPAQVAKPFFRWNHDVIMRRGGEGLAKRLGVKILENS